MKDKDGTDYGSLFRRDPDPTRRRAKADVFVTRAFPYVVGAALFAISVLIGAGRVGTTGEVLMAITFCFTATFTAFGLICALICDRGTIHYLKWLPIALVVPAVFSVILYFVGNHVFPSLLESRLFEFPMWTGLDLVLHDQYRNIVLLTIRLYVLMVVSLLAAHGVISSLAAHFRKHLFRIYRKMGTLKNDGSDPWWGRFALWVFKVPDVIDIHKVDVCGIPVEETFDKKTFTSLAVSVFVLGVVLSSYLFLNPIFLERVSFSQLMLISLTLSLFFPALVIPWYSARDTGAVIKSQARDYPLWKGLKSTLYGGFFAVSMFLFLMVLLLYYGGDLERVTLTYIGYVVSMAFISVLVSFVYTNHYRVGLSNGLIDQFDCEK